MAEKTESRRTVCETDGGNGQIVFKGFEGLSGSEYIMNFEAKQGTIAGFLMRGRENALTARDLERITGNDSRAVRNCIQRERLAGSPIMSGREGFWLASSVEDVLQCERSLWSRIREQMKTARALEAQRLQVARDSEGVADG